MASAGRRQFDRLSHDQSSILTEGWRCAFGIGTFKSLKSTFETVFFFVSRPRHDVIAESPNFGQNHSQQRGVNAWKEVIFKRRSNFKRIKVKKKMFSV